MTTTLRSTYYTIGIHVVIWGSLMAIPAVLFHDMPVHSGLPRGFFTVTNVYNIGLFYLNAYFMYPKLLNRKSWWLYVPAILLLLPVSYALKLYGLRLFDPGFHADEFNRRLLFFPPIPFLLASIFYRAIIDRIYWIKREKEIREERLASELKFLRSQVSPHFLFNMMTNMVALARKKSDKLEPSLIKLSELLRYMLYEPATGRALLRDEIEYLKNYVALQQLRFEEDLNVQLDTEEGPPDCTIEPMLLIPFVENAFKHGRGMVSVPFIRISLSVRQQQLHFSVINSYSPENGSKDNSSGIGLQNVKNRLLLLYPGRHCLDIHTGHEIFRIELKMDLTC
ncbi:MAG TPA: histidine kinase [Chitinophagaceae bacterium]|nr:histidine kinase [Chitinophagaceae bacterium]